MMTFESEQVKDFDPVHASVIAARQFTVAILREHGYSAWPAELLVSEVATNVIQHAHTPFRVSVSFRGSARVTVFDGSSDLPMLREARGDDEAGRGLFLVQALALRWGVDDEPGGKQVWFEVPREETAG